MQKPADYLNTVAAAAYLSRSPGALRNLVLRRAIPFRKPGGRLVFIRRELDLWIEHAPGIKIEDLIKEKKNDILK